MEFSFQRIIGHREMLADKIRMQSYQKAIHETVQNGDIVCDIGTGSGILAFFALQAGAKKVYAIEQNEIIEEAKNLAQLNGLDKKIVFLKGRSDKIELPEKVDVITSELIGYFGLEENLNRFKIDARERFLRPGGNLVPQWLELYLVPVQFNDFWSDKIGLWNKDFYGLDFSPVKESAAEERYLVADCANKVVSMAKPALISRLDFYKISSIPLSYYAEFTLNKNGHAHGLLGYFKAGLSRNVILSTSHQDRPTHWRQSFFPFSEPSQVKKDDKICCKVKSIPQGNNVFWQWEAVILRNGKRKAEFSHSNFKIDKEILIVGREGFIPVLTEEAKIYRKVINLCDGERTIEEISKTIFAEYPEKYRTVKDAIREIVGIIRGKVKIG